jgi:hypothetical protein
VVVEAGYRLPVSVGHYATHGLRLSAFRNDNVLINLAYAWSNFGGFFEALNRSEIRREDRQPSQQPKGLKGKKGSSANSIINSFKTAYITVLILHFLMI